MPFLVGQEREVSEDVFRDDIARGSVGFFLYRDIVFVDFECSSTFIGYHSLDGGVVGSACYKNLVGVVDYAYRVGLFCLYCHGRSGHGDGHCKK